MAVPDYQSLMIPVLKACADGTTVRASEVSKRVATALSLTESDLAELLPSGKAKLFSNRAGWARTYLLKAGLLSQPKRAFYQITDRGRQPLAAGLDKIDAKYLKQFPEFLAFIAPHGPAGDGDEGDTVGPSYPKDPLEMIEGGYASIRAELAVDLISQIKACSPEFFEQLVVDLLVAMGYGGSRADAGHAVGGSGDGGIDGIIKEDRLGLDAVYIQAKRWEGNVGGPVVQAFAGSLMGQKASKGVMITTSHYTKDAQAYVEKIEKKIVLIDGPRLAELMMDFGIGVTEVASYSIKRLDSDYFEVDAVQ
jgi:restriction system protein